MYEELEKGNSNTSQVLNNFEDEKIINHFTEIMAYDFEITDVQKAIEDIINIYEKEQLTKKRNEIIKQIEENANGDADKMKKLEEELNEIILKLAKIK